MVHVKSSIKAQKNRLKKSKNTDAQLYFNKQTIKLTSISYGGEISSIYRFKLVVLADTSTKSFFSAERFPKPAVLDCFGQRIDGLIKSSKLSFIQDKMTCELFFVPHLWLLTAQSKDRVFQDKTVPEILEDLLNPYKGQQLSYKFDLTRNYKKIPFTLASNETDFKFMEKLLEKSGIYFYFDFSKKAQVVFVDDNKITQPTLCHYSDFLHKSMQFTDRATVFHIESKILSKTFNPKDDKMLSFAPIKPDVSVRFASDQEHVKEDFLCAKKLNYFSSQAVLSLYIDIFDIYVGQTIRVENYPDATLNKTYLVVAVIDEHIEEHIDNLDFYKLMRDKVGNFNLIKVVPLNIRPVLKNPHKKRPTVNLLRASVQKDKKQAVLDEQGRYSVRFASVENDYPCYLYKAEFFGGTDGGFHMPLQENAPILVGFYEDNTDRSPFIQGALHDETHKPLNTRNSTKKHIIKTASGNQISMLGQGFYEPEPYLHIKNNISEVAVRYGNEIVIKTLHNEDVVLGKRLETTFGASVDVSAGIQVFSAPVQIISQMLPLMPTLNIFMPPDVHLQKLPIPTKFVIRWNILSPSQETGFLGKVHDITVNRDVLGPLLHYSYQRNQTFVKHAMNFQERESICGACSVRGVTSESYCRHSVNVAGEQSRGSQKFVENIKKKIVLSWIVLDRSTNYLRKTTSDSQNTETTTEKSRTKIVTFGKLSDNVAARTILIDRGVSII